MSQISFGDAACNKLRGLVETIDRDLAQRPVSGDAPSGALRAAWRELVQVLALGPAPQTRRCPVCGATGMRAASRCGNCWVKLEPLAALAPDAAVVASSEAAAEPVAPVVVTEPASAGAAPQVAV